MKKKMLFVIATIVAFALFVPSVMAASDPELVTMSGKNIFFANGKAITIKATEDNSEGALITWEGGSKVVPADVTVIGGLHNDDTLVNTSIKMTGGTVKHIFAGGLHKSSVGTASVTVSGGNVTGSVMGGGYAGFVNDEDFSTSTYAPADVKKDSIVRVEEATVIISGGSIGADVFGGGGGYSYTGKATVIIEDTYTGTIGYVSGSGSNGYTTEANVEINGGKVDVLQSVNRGLMEESKLVVNGGEVTNVYASSEGDTKEVGVSGTATVEINGGSVESVAAGQVPTSTSQEDEVEVVVTYKDGTVEKVNDDLADKDVVSYVQLTLVEVIDGKVGDSETVNVAKGSKIDKEVFEKELKDALKEENLYLFDGCYADKKLKTKFDFTKEINEDVTMYVSATTNPETGDVNLAVIIGTILVGVAGAFVVLRKRFAKSN